MSGRLTRRHLLQSTLAASGGIAGWHLAGSSAEAARYSTDMKRTIGRGLEWLAKNQSRLGHWAAGGQYRVPMTALAGMALLAEGSTATQGKFAKQIRSATQYLLRYSRTNGLIGDPNDYRYTYGHGFSMLFLSQVLGEEDDLDRRKEIIEALTKAVVFCGRAQTKAGGWGYVSAADGNDFDEGSTTVTQVQGLRGCRNAGIKVPKEIIDKAIKYIKDCTGPDGGVYYSSSSRGQGRPPITAASLACLFDAGEFKGKYVDKLFAYCQKRFKNLANPGGHWHYTYYYYTQVMYRMAARDEKHKKLWQDYRKQLYKKLKSDATYGQAADGSWRGNIGPVYVTSLNLTMLQLDKALLPIYQR